MFKIQTGYHSKRMAAHEKIPQPNLVLPKQAWFWIMPNLAVGLFVLAMGILLWVLQRHELEQQHNILLRDMQWAEQTLRLHMQVNQETFALLANDLAAGTLDADGFQIRASQHMANNPELVSIFWVREDKLIKWSAPFDANLYLPGQTLSQASSITALRQARTSNGAVYTPPLPADAGRYIEVYVPIFDRRNYRGSIGGVYSLQGMLRHLVPRWFSDKYALRFLDAQGRVLATSSNPAAANTTRDYSITLDTSGHGLILQASAYKTDSQLARTMLVALILGLSALIVWSLAALRRHMLRRAHAEATLRTEYALRKAIEGSVRTGLRAVDMQGRIIYVNRAFCDMVGWSEQELMGKAPPMPYWVSGDIDTNAAAFNAMLAGDPPRREVEVRFQRRDGEYIDVIQYVSPLVDAHDQQAGWMASMHDITERKRAAEVSRQQQENLQRTARLVTMGEMASSLAHEINQPLSAIANYSKGCMDRLSADTGTREHLLDALQKINLQADRAGKVIRRIRDFVRKREPQRHVCALRDIIENVIAFAEIEARAQGVKIKIEIAPALPSLRVDRILIEQVMLNLVKNGMESMHQTMRHRRTLGISVNPAENDFVEISVTDCGHGVLPESLEKLFSPFYTTKPDGMGMGLSICRSIIELHQGRLWVQPNPGGGSQFTFTLPVDLNSD